MGKHKFKLHRETQCIMYFHSKTHQRHSPSPPNLSSPPPPPPPSPLQTHVGGKSPHTVPIFLLHGIKCPFSDIVTLPYSDPSWSTDFEIETSVKLLVVSALYFAAGDCRFKSCWRRDSVKTQMAFHCTEPFIIVFPWS